MRLIIPAYFQALNKAGKVTDYAVTSNHMYIPIKSKKRGAMLIKKDEVKAWYELSAWKAKEWVNQTGWQIPPKEMLVIMDIWYFFKDNTHGDAGNYHKALGDFHHGIVVEDDKSLLWRDQDIQIDRENPRIELDFRVAGLKILPAKVKKKKVAKKDE